MRDRYYVKLQFGQYAGFFEVNPSEEGEKGIKALSIKEDDEARKLSKYASFQIIGEKEDIKKGVIDSLAWEGVSVQLEKGAVPIYPGLGVIFGSSGAGKTVLTGRIVEGLNLMYPNNVKLIRFGEPDLKPEYTKMALVTEEELVSAVIEFIHSPAKMLFIDSIRPLIYSTKAGATGKGGMDMTLYNKLTELSILAQKLGKSINVVFNPISADKAVVDNVKEAIAGSVETLYYVDATSKNLHITSRNHKAKRRKVTIPYNPEIEAAKLKSSVAEEILEFESELLAGSSFPGVLRDIYRKQMRSAYTNFGTGN